MVITRLTGDHNFDNLYKHGRRLRGVSVGLGYIKTTSSSTRVAIVVSKKISTKATKRNLYKRRLWGCVRANQQLLPLSNYHVVISAQPRIKETSFKELNQEVADLINKIH